MNIDGACHLSHNEEECINYIFKHVIGYLPFGHLIIPCPNSNNAEFHLIYWLEHIGYIEISITKFFVTF